MREKLNIGLIQDVSGCLDNLSPKTKWHVASMEHGASSFGDGAIVMFRDTILFWAVRSGEFLFDAVVLIEFDNLVVGKLFVSVTRFG
jgi:hypothetical protein